jgi:hypothetical protein
VTFTDSFPYDEAQFTGVERVKQKGSKLGFNVGTDVTVFFSRYIGLGGVARLSRADVSVPAPDGEGRMAVDAGGMYFGGGLRVRF